MYNINFGDVINALKNVENVHVTESIAHKDGVYREARFVIDVYEVTIEYIDFGRVNVPLKFYAKKANEGEIHFHSVDELCNTLNLHITYTNTGDEPFLISKNVDPMDKSALIPSAKSMG